MNIPYTTTLVRYTTFFACLLAFLSLTVLHAHAQMVTDLNSGPLFNEQNAAPGGTYNATIEVANAYSESKAVYIVGHNVTDPDDLADEMEIVITEGNIEHYDAPLSDFLAAVGGDISLGSITAGGETEYALSITFTDEGSQQNATLAFDICLGFAGGAMECAGSGNEEDPGNETPPTTTTGGGGSGGDFVTLSEDPTTSNDTTSLSTDGGVLGAATTFPTSGTGERGQDGMVAGATTEGGADSVNTITDEEGRTTTSEEDIGTNESNEDQTAAIALGSEGLADFFGSAECMLSFLITLLVIFLIWKATDALYGWKQTILPVVRTTRMLMFFFGGTAIAFGYAVVTKDCTIIPFAIMLVGSAGAFLWQLWGRGNEM